MPSPFDYYGYSDSEIRMVSSKTIEEEKQTEIDNVQDTLIDKAFSDNEQQQAEINRNSQSIQNIRNMIDDITGSTITDMDMGEW